MSISSLAEIPMEVSPSEIKVAAGRRRETISQAWNLSSNQIVILPSGLEIHPSASKLAYPFEPNPEYFYLTGHAEPRRVLVFDPNEGWMLFAHIKTDREAELTGDTRKPEEIKDETGIDNVHDAKELGSWLQKHKNNKMALLGADDILEEPWRYDLGEQLSSKDKQSLARCLRKRALKIEDETETLRTQEILAPPNMLEFAFDLIDDKNLRESLRASLNTARAIKDSIELALMRKAAEITVAVIREWMQIVMIEQTERQIRDYIDAQFTLRGAKPAFPTIVGLGPRAAILSGFEPTQRVAHKDETVLVDAGAAFGGLKSDITRVIPTGTSFTSDQRVLYDIVLTAHKRAIAGACAGTKISDLHAAAVLCVAEGLCGMEILNGKAEDRVEDGSVKKLFFSHPLGHPLGIHPHDLTFTPGCRSNTGKPVSGICTLEERHVMTIEPGVYLSGHLLQNKKIRGKFNGAVNWKRVDELLVSGHAGFGVRLEDDIVVTANGPPINLTEAIPIGIAEVEAMRSAD